MEVITREQALAKAEAIALETPVPMTEKATSLLFAQCVKTYFPEFEDFTHIHTFYYIHVVPGRFFDGYDSEDGLDASNGVMFNIEKAADQRIEMYASRYSYREMPLLDEIFEVMSFGAEPPSDRLELARVCDDLASIWREAVPCWHRALAYVKTGTPDPRGELMGRALKAGVDLSVEGYFNGVPAGFMANTIPRNTLEEARKWR